MQNINENGNFEFTFGPPAGVYTGPRQSQATKNNEHFAQVRESGRFQEFVENWSDNNTQGKLYNLEGITKIPVSMYVAENDFICAPDQAEAAALRIGTLQNYYTIKGEGHSFPRYNGGGDYGRKLMEELSGEFKSTPHFEDIEVVAKGSETEESTDIVSIFNYIMDSSTMLQMKLNLAFTFFLISAILANIQ